jgi:hypothetical protein
LYQQLIIVQALERRDIRASDLDSASVDTEDRIPSFVVNNNLIVDFDKHFRTEPPLRPDTGAFSALGA